MKSKLLFCSAGAFLLAFRLLAAPAATESIETSLRNMFKALDAGDRAGNLAYGPSRDTRFPAAAFDYDLENKPVVFEGAEAVNNFIGSMHDDMAKRRMKITSILSKLRSGSSSPELGFASFELAQTMTVDGRSESSRYRVTALLSQDSRTRKWRMFHWHATLIPATAPTSK